MRFFIIFSLLIAGLGTALANWDTNFHLIKSIRDGKFERVQEQLVKIKSAFEDGDNGGGPGIGDIIQIVCSFFPEGREINPQTLPELFEENEDGPVFNIPCLVQTIELIRNSCFGNLWPLLFIDSWAKLQSGFASGNIRNPGHFTQCLKFKYPMENDFAGEYLEGRHCNYGIGRMIEGSFNRSAYPPIIQGILPEEPIVDIGGLIPEDLPIFLEFGICLPKACDNQLIESISRLVLSLFNLGPSILMNDNFDKFCQVQEPPPLGAMEWGAVSLIIIGFAGVILSTIYEVVCVKLEYTPSEMNAAMSLYSNGKYLFTMRRNKDHVQSLYGLRALALIWMMLGYRFILPLIVPLINPLDFVFDFMDSYFAPWIFASQFGVDAILFLNATLITFVCMNKLRKSGHFKIWKHYLYRLMRVTPFIGILIFFMMTLSPYQSSGPYYRFLTEALTPACEEYWWSAMFHLQNYVNPDRLCILHTYLFSIDMQLFWAAPLILFPLYFFGTWFLLFIFLLLSLAVTCATVVSYYFGFQAFFVNMVVDFPKLTQYFRMVYFATHTRMGPWLIGVMCGYILHKLKGTKREINWFISALLWIISISGVIAVVYLLYPFHQVLDNNTSDAANYMYIGFARNVFALCLMWFVIGSYTGTGGVISWILELSIWQPISKMGISIYIVSLSATMVMVASWKTPYVFGISEMLQAFNSDLLIIFMFSTMTYLMIERPIMRVMKVILRIGQDKENEKEGIDDEQLTFDNPNPWKSFY